MQLFPTRRQSAFPALQAADPKSLLIAWCYQIEGEKLSQIIHLDDVAVARQVGDREPFPSRMVKLLAFHRLQPSPDEVPGEL
jgi:hypothetical protein